MSRHPGGTIGDEHHRWVFESDARIVLFHSSCLAEGGRFVTWRRLGGWTVMSTVVVAMLSPMAPGRADSFPLSSYPMFSARREDTSVKLVVAVERSADGGLHVLPTEATGHGHLTQAVRALKAAARDGGDRPQRLCQEVAAWLDRRSDGQPGRSASSRSATAR